MIAKFKKNQHLKKSSQNGYLVFVKSLLDTQLFSRFAIISSKTKTKTNPKIAIFFT